MFFKKPEPKCCAAPCLWIAVGMVAALGIVACTKQGRKFIKNKMECLSEKMENRAALSS